MAARILAIILDEDADIARDFAASAEFLFINRRLSSLFRGGVAPVVADSSAGAIGDSVPPLLMMAGSPSPISMDFGSA